MPGCSKGTFLCKGRLLFFGSLVFWGESGVKPRRIYGVKSNEDFVQYEVRRSRNGWYVCRVIQYLQAGSRASLGVPEGEMDGHVGLRSANGEGMGPLRRRETSCKRLHSLLLLLCSFQNALSPECSTLHLGPLDASSSSLLLTIGTRRQDAVEYPCRLRAGRHMNQSSGYCSPLSLSLKLRPRIFFFQWEWG